MNGKQPKIFFIILFVSILVAATSCVQRTRQLILRTQDNIPELTGTSMQAATALGFNIVNKSPGLIVAERPYVSGTGKDIMNIFIVKTELGTEVRVTIRPSHGQVGVVASWLEQDYRKLKEMLTSSFRNMEDVSITYTALP